MANRVSRVPAGPLIVPEAFAFEAVTLNREGVVVQRATGHARQAYEDLGGVYLSLVFLPGGSFQMGSQHEGGYDDERPLHPVFLKPFLLGKAPVTQAQWQAVMGSLPDCRFHGADLPVDTVCWLDAHEFCERLSAQTGRGYRLPSEAEWEYACRAGTSTPFSCGETITTDYANYVGLHTFRGEPPGVYRHVTTPAETFPPNPWGLYDMHGGMWEFCADNWSDDYSAAPLDGSPHWVGPQPGPGDPHPRRGGLFGSRKASAAPASRVARGGSWHEPPAHCRSATRLKVAEDDRMEVYGFRVALTPPA